jgi:predicted translin family RNA/ssDNA-binding protein
MELIKIKDEIDKKIKELDKARSHLREKAEQKAVKIAKYRKKLAITIFKLQNNDIEEFEGNPIIKLSVTLIPMMARGICWQEKMEMEKAEAIYKAIITDIEAIKAQLNGYQSIFRYLEN